LANRNAGTLSGKFGAIFQTSANRTGESAPTRFGEIDEAILAAVDLAIDDGELIGEPSTVVDVTGIEVDGGFEVLREGALPTTEVERRLGPILAG